ncbi:metallophosphoesterase family protein [Paenibacillus koleovorans]|uniref:metallophosphoesterase family protein n=1 Tax=Paenibacillus koleovorans TaxID=121608 RepID=UPI000FDB1857|nr:DNA repair exonuclease [Paenibacillus koleovorans]
MRAFRFMHVADLHLDSPFKGLAGLPERIRESIRESTFDALQRMIDTAIEEQVDGVLIAGDVYDGADRSLRAQLRFQRAMQRLAERGIAAYVVHGNHDPDDGRKAKLAWPETVHFFSSTEPECRPLEDRSGGLLAHVHGMSFGTSAVRDNLAARYAAREGGGFQIGLLHANVDGDAGHDNYAPCSTRQLAASGFHYWALGHIHSRRVLGEEPWIVYPGNIQGRSAREVGPKGCYIVDVSESGRAELRFRPLDAVRWFAETVSIEGMTTEQELRDELAFRLEQVDSGAAGGRSAVVRLQLEGRGPLHRALQSGSLLQELLGELREEQLRRAERGGWSGARLGLGGEERERWVWPESIVLRTGVELDRERLLRQEGFIGDLIASVNGLLEAGRSSSELEAYCRTALEPLLQHPKAGRLVEELLREEGADWLRAAEELALGLLTEEEGWDG